MFKSILLLSLISLLACQGTVGNLKFLSDTTKTTVYDISKEDSILTQALKPEFFHKLDSSNVSTDHSCEERKKTGLDPLTPAPYFFIPALKAKVLPNDTTVEWESACFKKNTATIVKYTKEETVVHLTRSDRKSWLCIKDTYFVSTFDFNFLHVSYSEKEDVVFKNLTEDQFDTIKTNGIKFHVFCQNIKESLVSIFQTAKLFVGGITDNPNSWFKFFSSHVPEYMETANINFVSEFAKFNMKKRTTDKKILEIDPKNIHSGDFVAIRRWDGVDPLIMWGTGSRIGHTAVAMWEDNELYIYESQDGWYWPRHGIQKNKWSYWIEHASNADFEVAIVPLREEYRKKFNVDKALEKYRELAGLDYGYRNFLFGWIDTPDKNLPYFIDFDILISIFTILERIAPSVVKMIIGEAINVRLGTKDLNIPQSAAEAARQGHSLPEVLAMPEKEEYRYSNGQNLVCSSFVTAMWKAGGIFDDMEIYPSEFGPHDVYQLNVFDSNPSLPQICKFTDPTIPYCQITGKYLIELPNFNTIDRYSHMNERCPSVGPDYIRQAGC